MAFTISSVCALPAPWSGRSDATMYFASLGPTGAAHADVGRAVRLPPPPPFFPPPPPHPAATTASAPVAARRDPTTTNFFTLPPPFCLEQASIRPSAPAFNSERAGYHWQAPKWRNWQTRWTQNPVG